MRAKREAPVTRDEQPNAPTISIRRRPADGRTQRAFVMRQGLPGHFLQSNGRMALVCIVADRQWLDGRVSIRQTDRTSAVPTYAERHSPGLT